MAVQRISIHDYLHKYYMLPVIDVRSEGEFTHAHIPGANSIPLFNNTERATIGTAYKQQSKETAIKLGLDFFGQKMRNIVEQTEQLQKNNSKAVIVHCWRGGMRSGAVAWLLDFYGFDVYVMEGGYKAFRQWVIKQFEKDYPFKILGGYTGSGKSKLLRQLATVVSVIDLEALGNHKGSAFGAIGMPEQPTQEMFENELAIKLQQCAEKSIIWLEDESQRIGKLNIPHELWNTMRKKTVYFLTLSFEDRLKNIIDEYGALDKEKMINAIIRIQKRLGPNETKMAVNHLIENKISDCFSILLSYYDKQYEKALHNRENAQELIRRIPFQNITTVKELLLTEHHSY